jgi:RNase H-fold protein (predicted Holliday junction resolvase)
MARRLKRLAGKKGKTTDDAQAAAIILQSYLDEGR